MANSFRKDPDAVLDYTIDWAAWLSGDTIATSTWAAETGITVNSSSHDTTTARVWLSGGKNRLVYKVTNHVTTTGGRADDRTLTITVAQEE